MNARAHAQLGLDHTHYSTPIGLDTPGNYSSASDLVKLADIRPDARSRSSRGRWRCRAPCSTPAARSAPSSTATTSSAACPWINGVKTGHTLDAGYVLVGSATRDGMTLLSAVLGTASEAAATRTRWRCSTTASRTSALRTPIRAGAVLARPTVKDQPGMQAVVVAAADVHARGSAQQSRADPRRRSRTSWTARCRSTPSSARSS